MRDKDYKLIGAKIDTFNVCRIQKSRIKSISEYYFTSEKDSTLIGRKRVFDHHGVDSFYIYNKSRSPIPVKDLQLDCSNYSLAYSSDKRGVYKAQLFIIGEDIIKEYDNLGYLTEYTEITRGIITRWLVVHAFAGTAKLHNFYEYSNDYKDVKCTWCFKDRLFDKECKIELIWYLKFDDNRNLLSEMKYRVQENGELKFEEGFKYHYDFF